MAERYPDVTRVADDIFDEFAEVLYDQLQTNTKYLNRLKGLVAQKDVKTKYGKSDQQTNRKSEVTAMKEGTDRRVEDILKALQTTNLEIEALVTSLRGIDLLTGFRDSTSSGISSGTDISDLSHIPVQDKQPHDPPPELVPMRPSTEYFMERQGAASQTPRRGRGANTRQEVDDMEAHEEESDISLSED